MPILLQFSPKVSKTWKFLSRGDLCPLYPSVKSPMQVIGWGFSPCDSSVGMDSAESGYLLFLYVGWKEVPFRPE